GAKHQAIGPSGILFENADLSAGGDLMNPVVGNVGEEHIPVPIHGRTFGELVALADHLPLLAWFEDLGDVAALPARGWLGDRLGVIAPEPSQRVGQYGGAVLVIVALVADDEGGVVAGVSERGRQVLVCDKPATGVNVLVVAAILQEDTQRLALGFANERR